MHGENMSGSDVWVEAAPRISKEKACLYGDVAQSKRA
jgi:hypothetical protein